MSDVKRGDDAADHPPASETKNAKPSAPSSDKQDAPNHEGRVDGGRAEPVEKVNAANDI